MDSIVRFMADGLLFVILLWGGVALLRGVPRKWWLQRYPYAVMAGLTALLVGKLLSLIYQPSVARPFLALGTQAGASYIDNPGFPSDHALLAGVVVLAVFGLTLYKKTAVALLVLTLLMSLGRVLAQVHTPIDIVGGLLAAAFGGVWYVSLRRSGMPGDILRGKQGR